MRALLVERARERRNPFTETDPAVAVAMLDGLTSTEHRPWVDAFMAEAERHAARGEWRAAYGYARAARYPSLTSPEKRAAYARSREWFVHASANAAPAITRVEIPFTGRPGEGDRIAAYLRIPAGTPAPVVVLWGGIDAFKEERRTDAYSREGWATLAIDMPGTGEAPISGSTDAERMWDPIFDWLASRPDVDGRRVAVVGSSTGGYWAAKLAHVRASRLVAAVDHGGPAHHAFARAWIVRAEAGEYPFEYVESLARAFGLAHGDDWLIEAPRFSLETLGVLQLPSAPLLALDGEDDSVFPIADLRLVASRPGAELRVFPGGHMGEGDTGGAIRTWLRRHLGG